MGYWSETVLGGDTQLDALAEFGDIAGIGFSLYPLQDISPSNAAAFSKGFESNIEAFRNLLPSGGGFPKSAFGREIRYVELQSLAAVLLATGTKIPEDFRVGLLESVEKDVWATESGTRKVVMNNLKEAILAYDGSTPILMRSEGFFDVTSKRAMKP